MYLHGVRGRIGIASLNGVEYRRVALVAALVRYIRVGRETSLVDQPIDQCVMHRDEDWIAGNLSEDAMKSDVRDREQTGLRYRITVPLQRLAKRPDLQICRVLGCMSRKARFHKKTGLLEMLYAMRLLKQQVGHA